MTIEMRSEIIPYFYEIGDFKAQENSAVQVPADTQSSQEVINTNPILPYEFEGSVPQGTGISDSTSQGS